MKNRQNEAIEERISCAAKQMIPEDMYERITQSIAQEERTMSMKNTNKKPEASQRKRIPRWMGAVAAACFLLIGGVFGGNYYYNNMMVDTVVDIDVNPGIEISTNKNEMVLGVTAINSDAEKVLDGMNLKNTQLKVAVNAIVGSMVRNGYLVDGENSILVTVRNEDAQRAAHIRNLIVTDIDASLKDNHITASVVNQTVTDGASAKTFAEQHGISFGKAVFILNLCAKDSSLDSAALAKMSIKEIAALTVEKGIDIRDIVDYDADDSIWENIEDTVEDMNEDHQAGQSGAAISADKAKEIALAHAGVAAAEAAHVLAELDTDDGVSVYDISFTAGGVEYDCEIDATTGRVVSFSKEAADQDDQSQAGAEGQGQQQPSAASTAPTAPTAALSAAAAKETALRHAGVTAADAAFIKVELDTEDGVLIYEIEFCVGPMEYEYEINASTGSVMHSEASPED